MNKKIIILGAGMLAVGAALYARRQGAQDSTSTDTPDSTDYSTPQTIADWMTQNIMESDITSTLLPLIDNSSTSTISPNVRAFISMISSCEGTINAGGYAALYGSTPGNIKTFNSWADHPRLAQRISSTDQRWTSAAGLLQWMAVSPIPTGGSTRVDTWDRMQKKLNLPDFSPESQDRAAVALFTDFGALGDIEAGRVMQATRKLKSQWASLPGAGYGQGERSESFVVSKYTQAGGVLA